MCMVFDPTHSRPVRSMVGLMDRRFRYSSSRSHLDRFSVCISAASVIMPPRRANTWNANACNANAVLLIPNHEVTNAEFWIVIQLLA
uniref:Uncharacterized protein n=1 Tax=Solanum tuberosum TaxID=4113 RepID=M1DU31_SOLTU